MRSLYTILQRKHGKPVDGWTRREMLRVTLAGSAGLLVSNNSRSARANPASASW